MADKAREDRPPVAPATANSSHSIPVGEASVSGIRLSSRRRTNHHRTPRQDLSSSEGAVSQAHLETIGGNDGANGEGHRQSDRIIRSTPAIYRWVCPCQEPPVLLATYGPNARINIKVRDRYWHLHGFGMVETICPRCAAEHLLDLRHLSHLGQLHHTLGDEESTRRSS